MKSEKVIILLSKIKSFLIENFLYIQRYREAVKYFQNLVVLNTHVPEREVSTKFAAIVITKKRFVCNGDEFDCEPHYLQQTLAALDRQIKLNSVNSIPVVVCSVDSHWENHLDLNEVKNYFPLILRYNNTEDDKPSNKKQETSDYAFCLEEASHKFAKTKYLIVLEDDAIVFDNFVTTLSSIVSDRLETNIVRGEKVNSDRQWVWMKLYFNEFWCGFGWDANRLWELFWIAIAGGMIGAMLAFLAQTMKRTKVSALWWACNGSLYLLLLVIVISRQTWLETRRIHVSLMQVTPDSGCCSTTAVLYPMDEIPRLVDYLRSSKCYRCRHGVDLAIRDYKDNFKMLGLLVQPNLARHIGQHSTVSSDYKDPIHMLFYDFL